MKTFHVGSLPFLNTKQALDFTFKFDIPTLFTLPKLNEGQLIGGDMIHLLDLGSMKGYENIHLNDPKLTESKPLVPYFYKEFMERLKSSGKKQFKYQSIGPISFYSLLKRSNKIEFKDVYRFLLKTYSDLYLKLSEHGEVIFVLDEPMLGQDFLSTHEALNNFVADLKKLYPEVLVHCCAKLSLEEIKKLSVDLNIDLNLYDDSELRSLEVAAPGLSVLADKNYNILLIKNIIQKAKYFTPSCGLTYKSVKELDDILAFMQDLSS